MREAIESGEFCVTCEVIPGRGAAEASQVHEFETAEKIWATGRAHAISVTDNPSGNPALLADSYAGDFQAKGITPLIHFTCKDRSRNQIQSQYYAMQRNGMENLLLMSGDYQTSGWSGVARPVYDLDPIHLVQMALDMNEGLVVQGRGGDTREMPANFFPGTVVNPFKYLEGETIPQYFKLEKKVIAGSKFVITQLGYDTRKMEELKFYLEDNGYKQPIIANIFLLNLGAARLMRQNIIAGCYINDELMATLEAEAKEEDKGKAARFLRAAKMVAIARGLGFAGVHIGGFGITVDGFNYILDTADELQDQWREFAAEISYGKPDGFYYYQPELDANGKPTGLNDRTVSPRPEKVRNRKIMAVYGLSRVFHHWVLTEDKRFFGILRAVMAWRQNKKGLHRSHFIEHLAKTVLYHCQDCGDCGLEPAIYTCPMSRCPKNQRNGPCGGTVNGWCEVYPNERYCIYFKAYHRLKKFDELYKIDTFLTVPNDWALNETSGWASYTHKVDNTSKRVYLAPRGERGKALEEAAAAAAAAAAAPAAVAEEA
ncbi:MAG: methylenetetrahydrofolate reductase C-terminal domain-containing protein [Coriobacteriia bacterium]|nr:methylenetetrahydrofolate reductase C-terminal domain-containing protein [Coriobacteriia bacterium]